MTSRQTHLKAIRKNDERAGTALVTASVLISTLSVLALSALMVTNSAISEQVGVRNELAARYAAHGGMAEGTARLRAGLDVNLGNPDQPVEIGGSSFWVQGFDLGNGNVSLVATGNFGGSDSRQQSVLREVPYTIYRYAAFGDESMTMDSNAHTDSYDSDLGTYADQEVNGSGQSAWARDWGHIGSNGDIVMRQNSRTYGNAAPGPGRSASVLGNAFVTGSTAPASERMELKPLNIPAIPSSGPLSISPNGTKTIGPGPAAYGNAYVKYNGTLRIVGPAEIVFDSFEVWSNAQVEIDASQGMVEIYVINDFVLSSNAAIAPVDNDPANLAIYLESDNIIDPGLKVDLDEIDLKSNSSIHGTIYAPHANLIVNSNFELFGSMIAQRVHLDSNAQVHYDEALARKRQEELPRMAVVGWRELPANVDLAELMGGAAHFEALKPGGLGGSDPDDPNYDPDSPTDPDTTDPGGMDGYQDETSGQTQ